MNCATAAFCVDIGKLEVGFRPDESAPIPSCQRVYEQSSNPAPSGKKDHVIIIIIKSSKRLNIIGQLYGIARVEHTWRVCWINESGKSANDRR